MKYRYTDRAGSDPKIRLVTDNDGHLYVRKNVHIDSLLSEKLLKISCPFIVKFIEFGEDDDGEYVIEEYIEGISAAERSFTNGYANTGTTDRYFVFMNAASRKISYTTSIGKSGYYSDECDFVFYNDTNVIGSWNIIGALAKNDLDKFTSGINVLERGGAFWLQNITFMFDGTAKTRLRGGGYFDYLWTNGYFIKKSDDGQCICEYFPVTVKGTEYLILENKNGDYTKEGITDNYFVLTRGDADNTTSSPDISTPEKFTFTTVVNDNGEYEDVYDYVFIDDPHLRGEWETVGGIMARKYEDWLNGTAKADTDINAWLRNISFGADGKASVNDDAIGGLWTAGYFIRTGQSLVFPLSIVTVGGEEYLVIENKNNDFKRKGTISSYFILARKSG